MRCYQIIRNILISGYASALLFTTAAVAQDIKCSTVEACVQATNLILQDEANQKNSHRQNDITTAFSALEQDGFDALFDLTTNTDNIQHREILMYPLWSLTRPSEDRVAIKMSNVQYDRVLKLTHISPSYYTLSILNSADTPRSHRDIIEALQSPDKDRQHWAEQLFRRDKLGNSETPVEAKHMDDLIQLIQTRKSLAALKILMRIDNQAAEDALWSLLDTDSRWIFQDLFSTLVKRDRKRLYRSIKNLEFERTLSDEARALRIAKVIVQHRHKKTPTQKSYDYWKYWFETTEPEGTEHLIPTYIIFSTHMKLTNDVARSEKTIARYRDWLNEPEEERSLRRQKISDAYLNQLIEREEKIKPALLQQTTMLLTQDEGAIMRDYIRIFELMRQTSDLNPYSSWRLPLHEVLDNAVQTPKLWVDALVPYLNCGPKLDNYALMKFIVDSDPANAHLKTCLGKQLTYTNNMPKLIETLSFITNNAELREDPVIRMAVSQIDENTPFTQLRVARQFALKNSSIEKVRRSSLYAYSGPRNAQKETINKARSYCDAQAVGDFNYLETSQIFKKPLFPLLRQLGPPVMTVKTPSGFLTGHDRGEFGGGLLYYPDENSAAISLHDINVIAIIESDTKGIYWSISGLNHMIPGTGTLHRIDARTDDVSVEINKLMPIVSRNVKRLENGGIFMDFWKRSYTSYNGKTGDKIITDNPSYEYNPPIVLTKVGDIRSACGD